MREKTELANICQSIIKNEIMKRTKGRICSEHCVFPSALATPGKQHKVFPGYQKFSREEMQSGKKRREREGEKTSCCPRQLIDLTVPIDLNQGQDLTLPPDWRNLIAYPDWLLLTDRCVVIGCLLINSCDTYRSMIVRFASLATRGFLSPLLSLLSHLFAMKENLWDQGTRSQVIATTQIIQAVQDSEKKYLAYAIDEFANQSKSIPIEINR